MIPTSTFVHFLVPIPRSPSPSKTPTQSLALMDLDPIPSNFLQTRRGLHYGEFSNYEPMSPPPPPPRSSPRISSGWTSCRSFRSTTFPPPFSPRFFFFFFYEFLPLMNVTVDDVVTFPPCRCEVTLFFPSRTAPGSNATSSFSEVNFGCNGKGLDSRQIFPLTGEMPRPGPGLVPVTFDFFFPPFYE